MLAAGFEVRVGIEAGAPRREQYHIARLDKAGGALNRVIERGYEVDLAQDTEHGVGELLARIEASGLRNVRVVEGDALVLLERSVDPSSLAGVRTFFPDPWPKARHHKRRFLQPGTIGLIVDRLLPGGVLHVATDHAGYAEHIAEVGDAEPRLSRADPAGAGLPMSVVRPTTKYETKAHEAGSAVTEFIWLRHE